MVRVALVLVAALVASPALADAGAIPLTLKAHKFTPATIHVKANQPNVITLSNNDDTAEEFDSTALKVEKVVAGHSKGDVRLRPLGAGPLSVHGRISIPKRRRAS